MYISSCLAPHPQDLENAWFSFFLAREQMLVTFYLIALWQSLRHWSRAWGVIRSEAPTKPLQLVWQLMKLKKRDGKPFPWFTFQQSLQLTQWKCISIQGWINTTEPYLRTSQEGGKEVWHTVSWRTEAPTALVQDITSGLKWQNLYLFHCKNKIYREGLTAIDCVIHLLSIG